MKKWKMMTIVTLAVLAVASISTFAFACYYSNGPFLMLPDLFTLVTLSALLYLSLRY